MQLLNYLDPKSDHTSAELSLIKDKLSNESFKRSCNVLTANVRSLRKNFNDLCSTIDSLECFFSVIILNETWLEKNEENQFKLKNYRIFCIHRNKLGGGVLIYVSKSLKATVLKDVKLMTKCIESLFLQVTFNDGKKLTLGTIYRPPSSSLTRFNNELEAKILNKLPSSNLLIAGDLNINLLADVNDNNLRFVQIMNNNNLQNLISSPTRKVESMINGKLTESVSIIDHIWTNLPELPKSFVIQYHLTDHFPIACSINIYKNTDKKTIVFRSFSDENCRIFSERFHYFCENFEILPNSDINELFMKLINFLTDLINELFPIKTRNCKLKSIKSPWICKKLQLCIDKKISIYRGYKSGRLPITTYKNYRNMLNKALNLAKRQHFFNQFSENLSSKDLWNKLNKIIKPCKESIDLKLKSAEFESDDPDTISNFLNEFFLSYNPVQKDNT